ncbi:proline-rich receptor-like protein kinase PERK2 [Iris pallida]|uniref:Proline-rich receptor-like protein kinase PERK2 n=1 Tax=Iris pallida TaxID=29817 RepID=A0AAX6GDU0_IRIPA|nr:proline-rich receptor-like protein kinase PERK2 [Iris pallida]
MDRIWWIDPVMAAPRVQSAVVSMLAASRATGESEEGRRDRVSVRQFSLGFLFFLRWWLKWFLGRPCRPVDTDTILGL